MARSIVKQTGNNQNQSCSFQMSSKGTGSELKPGTVRRHMASVCGTITNPETWACDAKIGHANN